MYGNKLEKKKHFSQGVSGLGGSISNLAFVAFDKQDSDAAINIEDNKPKISELTLLKE